MTTTIEAAPEMYIPSAQESRAARIAELSEKLKDAAERLRYHDIFSLSAEIDALATEIQAVNL